MLKLEVFDPPMCCSTGVCGPTIDPDLARFAGDLEWLKKQNLTVVRYNLSQEPAVFVESAIVKQELDARGNSCLPLVLANGRVIASGFYPQRKDLESVLKGLGVEFRNEEKSYCEPKGGCC